MPSRFKLKAEYSAPELADLVGCTRQTIWRKIQSGELRAHKRGSDYRISLETIRQNHDLWESIQIIQRARQLRP